MPHGARAVAVPVDPATVQAPSPSSSAVPLGPRLPRAAPRESARSMPRRASMAPPRCGSPTPACRRFAARRRGRSRRARVVPPLPLRRRARARPRRRRGPGRPGVIRCSMSRRPRGVRVRGRAVRRPAAGRCPMPSRGGHAAAAGAERRAAGIRVAAAPRRRRLRRAPRRRPHDHRRLPVVHRLGPRHLHRAARALPRHRPARRRARHPARVGGAVVAGMLPNRFPDAGEAPEFNAVDASLWYVVAVDELPGRGRPRPRLLSTRPAQPAARRGRRDPDGYAAGTRYGIRVDDDGLLAAGEPGRAAHLDGRQGRRLGGHAAHRQAGRGAGAVAERAAPAARLRRALAEAFARGRARFERALLERGAAAASSTSSTSITSAGVVDATVPPEPDPRRRRPAAAAARRRARGRGRRRWSSASSGRRSACARWRRDEPGYAGRYDGRPACATAPITRAPCGRGCSGRSSTPGCACAATARTGGPRRERRFLAPLRDHLDEAGLGHVSEIADGDPPHTPRGCPFQAWSVGELLRIEAGLSAADAPAPARRVAI